MTLLPPESVVAARRPCWITRPLRRTFEVAYLTFPTLQCPASNSRLESVSVLPIRFGTRQWVGPSARSAAPISVVSSACDVAHYEGKITLITIGLGEAAIAANQCVARARGVKLQPAYSTE